MVGPSMPDAEKVAAVREALPAVGAGIYLNTPQAGPLPAESAAAMAEIGGWEVRTGRAHRDWAADAAARLEEARAAVAAILTTDLDDVLISHGLEDAFARAVRGIEWESGDRALIIEPGALPGLRRALPPGVDVQIATVADVDVGLASTGGRPTRLVALPMVSPTSGERLPVERIAAATHAAGARVLVDASLAVGAIPTRPADLGADLLVARSDAWLLGPQGLAAVAGSIGELPGDTFHLPSIVGLARGCGWLSMYIGLAWIHERGQALTERLAARLAAIDRVRLVTPPARATTLVVAIDGWTADEALAELGARIFLLAGTVPEHEAMRVGVGFWNTEAELDRLADAISLLASHTPETLPRRRLTMFGEG